MRLHEAPLAEPSQHRGERDAQPERQRHHAPAHVVGARDVVPEPVGAVLDDPLEADEDEGVRGADEQRGTGEQGDGTHGRRVHRRGG